MKRAKVIVDDEDAQKRLQHAKSLECVKARFSEAVKRKRPRSGR